MVALLGSSGAGKSSLMDILGHRTKTGVIGGFVGLACETHRAKSVDEVISYVLQDDQLVSTMTVREAILFAAKMRLSPQLYPKEEIIQEKVNQILKQLHIAHIAGSRIGSPDSGGGISGGERKRVAIGMELIADPRILLLDEPTSGLDSTSANIVMQVELCCVLCVVCCVLCVVLHEMQFEIESVHNH